MCFASVSIVARLVALVSIVVAPWREALPILCYAVGGNVGDEADVDGVLDVDVVGAATEFDDVFEFLVVGFDVGVGWHGAIQLAGMAAGIPGCFAWVVGSGDFGCSGFTGWFGGRLLGWL